MSGLQANFRIDNDRELSANFNVAQSQSIDAVFKIENVISSHNQLDGRDDENCHPIEAITGLREELDQIEHNQKPIIGEGLVEVTESDEDITITTKTFVHEQGVASAVWTVQHNLNKRPSVNVVDSAGNEIVAEVIYDTNNSLTIRMKGASKGFAYLN